MKNFFIRAFCCFIFIFQVSCATNQVNAVSGNELIGRSTWIEYSKSVDTIFYFDPLQTIYSLSGDVTAVISGVKISNSQTLMPSLIKVNCSNKMIRTYEHDNLGNWELRQDWKYSEGTTLGALKNLCKNDGKVMLGSWEVKNDPGTYTYLSWDYDVEYQPAMPDSKTFKFYEYKTPSREFFYYYFMSNCNDRTFAISNKLTLEKLNWQPTPAKNTPQSYLLTKSCGVAQNLVPQGKISPASISPIINDELKNISDAKNKCVELGLTQGTEGFGKCVLQLSK